MTPEAWIVTYQSQARLIFAIAASEPDEEVPSCPGWSLRELAAHVGSAPALWGPVLEAPPGSPPGEVLRPPVPESLEEMLTWCEIELMSMVELFRATDPHAPVWTGADGGTASFWMRRAALETAVHLWDAANAAGMRPEIPSDLASDGFDELVELFPILSGWSGTHPERSLRVQPTDVSRNWMLLGATAAASPVELSGRAGDLYLQLWGRRPPRPEQRDVVDEWAALIQEMAA